MKFATQAQLRNAFEALTRGGAGEYQLDWHWTPLAALVTDCYGVEWMLCV